jgi:shikimate dehydrogenase
MPRIDARTKTCAVIGHPVGHSLSPAIHNAAFEALDLPYVYVAHDVLPAHLPAALEGARALGYRGLSVTIPHKATALSRVDEADATARGIGCVNTIVNDQGRLLGSNSDGRGALKALRDAGADPTGRRVVLLGSGGAARAIAVTIALEAPPERLVILGIELGELDQLVRDVAGLRRCEVDGRELSAALLREQLARADLLMNCTPVGMYPDTDASPVPAELLRPAMTVFDAVYNPRRTKLLVAAAAAGCPTVEGVQMFLGQAAVQFELWTGSKAPIGVMRRVLEERL